MNKLAPSGPSAYAMNKTQINEPQATTQLGFNIAKWWDKNSSTRKSNKKVTNFMADCNIHLPAYSQRQKNVEHSCTNSILDRTERE